VELTTAQRRTALAAALLGNALEWYDFAVYAYLATPLGRAFFPADEPALQLIAAFGVFAVGYLMRPVGSLVLGPIGDLLGRRQMLSLSILLMGAASLAIGLLPTHAQWGAAAGVCLVALRLVQGFSLGGEFTGSMTFATEAARPGREGLLSSLATAGGLVGFSLGSLTVALLAWWLGDAAVQAWGWRLPFLLGGTVAAMGLWMRRGMPETLVGVEPWRGRRDPAALGSAIGERLLSLRHQWPLVVRIGALVAFANVVFYVLFVFMVDFAGHRPGSDMAGANAIATLLQTLGLPLVVLGGVLADRIGRVRANRLGNLLLLLVTPVALPLAQLGGLAGLAAGQAIALLPVMGTIGAQGVLAVEMVPPAQRCTIFSIAYSLAMALFGGTAPLVCSWLLEVRGWQWGPALYCCLYALPALWALTGVRSGRPAAGLAAGVPLDRPSS
jgi:MHS family proline/betaine transporter-like MFS transporter